MDEGFASGIEDAFKCPAFSDMWHMIHVLYQRMGFNDKLSDKERIDEYTWITQQFRKFVLTREKMVTENMRNPTKILKRLEATMAKATEFADDRKHLVYNMMRDDWLVSMINMVSAYTDDEER